MDTLEEGFSYRLKELVEMLVTGKYHRVLDKTNEILQKNDLIEEERIEVMIWKSNSLLSLSTYEFREGYLKEGADLIEEALQKSEEIKDILLMFDSLYCKIWSLSSESKYKEAFNGVEKIEEFYDNIHFYKNKTGSFFLLDHFCSFKQIGCSFI